jgi:hypothetical protein
MAPKSRDNDRGAGNAIAVATGRNMAEALNYLAGIASRAGLARIALKLRIVREDLILTINNHAGRADEDADKTGMDRPVRGHH